MQRVYVRVVSPPLQQKPSRDTTTDADRVLVTLRVGKSVIKVTGRDIERAEDGAQK